MIVYPLTVRGSKSSAHALSGETNPTKHLNLDVLLPVSRRGQRNGTVASGFIMVAAVLTSLNKCKKCNPLCTVQHTNRGELHIIFSSPIACTTSKN